MIIWSGAVVLCFLACYLVGAGVWLGMEAFGVENRPLYVVALALAPTVLISAIVLKGWADRFLRGSGHGGFFKFSRSVLSNVGLDIASHPRLFFIPLRYWSLVPLITGIWWIFEPIS